MAHGRRCFSQLDLAAGGNDGAFQIAGRGGEPVHVQAQPLAGGTVRGPQVLQLGGAKTGRLERLELASERGPRFQDHGDPEQRLAALDDEGVAARRQQAELSGRNLKKPDLEARVADGLQLAERHALPLAEAVRLPGEDPVLFIEPAHALLRVHDGARRGQGGFESALRQRILRGP